MDKTKKILAATKKLLVIVRKFFYLKESECPGYMSDEEIARIINSPLTKEQKDNFPHEFAKNVRRILDEEDHSFPREFGKSVSRILELDSSI